MSPSNARLQELDCYISVDVETAGPDPAEYALLSIGACTLVEPRRTFYVELQPDRPGTTLEAQAVHRLDLDQLASEGKEPADALQDFRAWLAEVVPAGKQPIFVAFNAPFDWMFINQYFQRYLRCNPFGHSALDIKAFAMGSEQIAWKETGYDKLINRLGLSKPLTHNALQDALDQADLFQLLMTIQSRPIPSTDRSV